VPRGDEAQANASSQRQGQPVFERSDFVELFQPSDPEEASPIATIEPESEPFAALGFPVVPQTKPQSTGYDVEPLGPVGTLPLAIPTTTSPGIMLSSRQATLLTITVILMLALAFGAGLAVGRFLL